ncbi:MAG: von Willebrand factor type A domain-containing protein [Anaerolineales bacterium]|uniref:von Willebrand factor type A domain-containing protein n=1 Tax=Candidatus Desulfolinea nitratireducens TaxID=2841698 RepID=A0A8J6TE27_9CHLR|nr:von Willebrand factor type A domain-containing protein [Candidatus Desulfolinea nitratireducens]MBL6959915.1 von Willebrand factor type A domain-containing protein [Anaerolineales bacterium]
MSAKKIALNMMILAAFILGACGGLNSPAEQEPNSPALYEEFAPSPEEPAAESNPSPYSAGDSDSASEKTAESSAPSNFSSNQPQSTPSAMFRSQTRDEGPNDMFFEDYGVNPIIDTEDDHFSTFALDVDTGSYTLMRNYINDGNLPPEDSVRVEEYVNYFEQGYPLPSAHQAFGIHLDGGPSPFTQTERYEMLRVGIQGYEVSDRERKDVSLTFVIDVSGSMDMDNRLGMVKRSLEMLVEQLGRGDQVSIVVYGSEARVVLEPTSASKKGLILDAIYSLRSEGSTNAEAGIKLGYKMALRGYNADGVNRVILCSDGVANVGRVEANAILDEVHGYVEEGVTMATFGFGMDNYNDTLMEQLADNGDGFYAYIDDLNEAKRLFVDDLTSTLQTIAMDAKVQVDFNPDVVSRYRLVGYENRDIADEDFRDNSVDAGEIGAGHSVTALYEIKLFGGAHGRIATVHMRWEDPDTRQVMEIEKDIHTGDLEEKFHDADPYFQRAVVVAEYAEILGDSYWAEESDIDDVYDEARWLEEYFPREEAMEEFVDLVKEAIRQRRW